MVEFRSTQLYDARRMKEAFKEWAVVVDALETGTQSIILRKGGIAEGKGGFQLDHRSFWLFPTQFHQQHEMVIDSAKKRYEKISKDLTPEGFVRISSYAEIVAAYDIQENQEAENLSDLHIWKDHVIRERFDWGKRKDIHALAVRTFILPSPAEIPLLDSYGGCKSWINLEEDISTEGAIPAIDDAAFGTILEQFHVSLSHSKRII